MSEHVHNTYTCPAHVVPCDCEDLPNMTCNPYHIAGACPDDLDVMPEVADSPDP